MHNANGVARARYFVRVISLVAGTRKRRREGGMVEPWAGSERDRFRTRYDLPSFPPPLLLLTNLPFFSFFLSSPRDYIPSSSRRPTTSKRDLEFLWKITFQPSFFFFFFLSIPGRRFVSFRLFNLSLFSFFFFLGCKSYWGKFRFVKESAMKRQIFVIFDG